MSAVVASLRAAGPGTHRSGVLVVGYGNVLRGDDAVGWHVVTRLATDRRLDGARVVWQHQLTPELAHDFAASSMVVLVDAETGPAPGAVSVRRVDPADGGPAAVSHHVAPESLLAMASELYGSVPATWVIGVGAARLEVGDTLSAQVEAAIPAVVDAVAAIVEGHADA